MMCDCDHSCCLRWIVFLSARANRAVPAGVTSDFDLYYRIFHHVAVLKQMADEAKQQGKDRSNLRQLVRLRVGLHRLRRRAGDRRGLHYAGVRWANQHHDRHLYGQSILFRDFLLLPGN